MIDLLQRYGDSLPSAEKLLALASALRQQDQPLDTLHILAAALKSQDAETPGCKALQTCIDKGKQENWMERIQLELRQGILGQALPEGMTMSLHRYLEQCEQKARKDRLFLTDALILWILLSKDDLIRDMLSRCRIEPDVLLKGLEDAFKQSAPVPPPLPLPQRGTQVQPLPPPPSPDAQALAKATALTRLLRYDASALDADMHNIPMSYFLDALGASATSMESEIIILTGHHGSPIEELSQLLAYRLAAKEPFVGVRKPLSEYSTVRRLNIEALLRLVDEPEEPLPHKVLEKAKQYALEQKAVLLLDNIHLLKGQGKNEMSVKAALADRGDGLIFGLYIYHGATPSERDLRLGMENTLLVPVAPYDEEDTKKFLQKYHFPRWEANGYIFTEDAFDSIIKLEPGAWIREKRKTLPYLASGLGEDTFQIALRGEREIKETADCARYWLNELLNKERKHVTEAIQEKYAEVLGEAERDIRALNQNPKPLQQGNKKVLTRAHVIAQLICHNASEFHYDGFTPEWAKKTRTHTRQSSKSNQGK